jgi:hypothetical protein
MGASLMQAPPGRVPQWVIVTAAYTLLAVISTWPLVMGLGRDVPWDLGDPLLVMWILAWDCTQLLGALGGDFSRLTGLFDANIFYPVPLTLAYSEHLIAQALQILPVYALSGNPILAYNILFLSTSVLSGLGVFLLVRELTGSRVAGFVGGLLFAFAPYRLSQSGHLQVLSSQWMPFVLFGLRRYFVTRRWAPLAGAGIALVFQNLSSGYYLLFFSPIAAGFALWEVCSRGLWRDLRVWRDLACVGACVVLLTAPVLAPYAALRSQWPAARSVDEIVGYSADVYSYATAFSEQRIWRGLRTFPKPEGELFPGLVPLFLALSGVLAGLTGGRRSAIPQGAARRGFTWLLTAAAVGHACAAMLAIAFRRVVIDTGWFVLRISNANQMILRAVLAFGLLLAVSPIVRARTLPFLRERGFYVVALAAVLWLSLGPIPQAFGRPIEIVSPYLALYEHVPGFDGLRVPARLAMIVSLMLAVLGGFGAHALARLPHGRAGLAVICMFFFLEATHLPFTLNGMAPVRDLVTPEARVRPLDEAPPIYAAVAELPAGSVIVELPLGQPDYDLRAMYYSIRHWRPLVNGYSGFFPAHYGQLQTALSEVPRHPDVSIEAIRATRATHVLVHEGAYRDSEGPDTTAALAARGATVLFEDAGDVLLQLAR